jgi:hypothetical protein
MMVVIARAFVALACAVVAAAADPTVAQTL